MSMPAQNREKKLNFFENGTPMQGSKNPSQLKLPGECYTAS